MSETINLSGVPETMLQTVYCAGQKYLGKGDEIRQVESFLRSRNVTRLELVAASSIGADLALAFLSQTKLPPLPY